MSDEIKGFEWIKRGYTCEDGSLDDARASASLMVIAYIAMGLWGFYKIESNDMAPFIQSWGIGAAALAGGIGGWFKLRGGN